MRTFSLWKTAICLSLSLALLAGCCPGISYEIEMEVTDEGFLRTVSVTSSATPPPEPADTDSAEQQPMLPDRIRLRMEPIYGEGEAIEDGRRYRQQFHDQTPQDIGGAGSIVRVASDLGTLFYYHERFGGALPTLAARQHRQQSIDTTIDWLAQWLRFDLQAYDAEHADKLVEFAETTLRTDAQDLMALLETLAAHQGPRDDQSHANAMLQVGHLLVERDYLTPVELARLFLLEPEQEQANKLAIDALRGRVSRSAEVPYDAPVLSRLFDDPEATGERVLEFVRTLPEYEAFLVRQQSAERPADKPEDLITEQLEPVLAVVIGGALRCGENVQVRLRLPLEPYQTNGRWDDGEGSVSWQHRLVGDGGDAAVVGLPRLAHAAWAVPDSQRQVEWFGEIVLEDERLAQYCRWYSELSADDAGQWSQLVEAIRSDAAPGSDQIAEYLATDAATASEPVLREILTKLQQSTAARD